MLIGNFIADFIANREVAHYQPPVQRGIALHRAIDVFTDQHPLVRQGMRRLYPDHSKYASVVIDVFYDHLLAVNWERYSTEPLVDFARATYIILEKNRMHMPPVLQHRLPLMIADNWLANYARTEGIAYTFERMKRRASRPRLLDGTVDTLQRDFLMLNEEFNLFFPEVQALAASFFTT